MAEVRELQEAQLQGESGRDVMHRAGRALLLPGPTLHLTAGAIILVEFPHPASAAFWDGKQYGQGS